jgi:dolichyl-phosphate-mannose-protein mannosyltransferase
MSHLTIIFPVAAALIVLLFFAGYFPLLRHGGPHVLSGRLELMPEHIHRTERGDALPILLITLAYGVVAFCGLGDRSAPQTFCHFQERGNYVLVELKEETEVSTILYYSGLKSGEYRLQFSADGENFVDQTGMPQAHGDLFKWQYAELLEQPQTVKYIRITADTELYLGELALYDRDGNRIPADALIYNAGAAPLFDEQALVPASPTYLNSAYFDEIYHARTAYENVEGIYPYEVSHPPLGKLIISIGIQLFGMTPFGWRFMGTLFGAAMLPVLYIFLKRLFGTRVVASCGTLIFAFDFMHFVQTRIATIDTYAVFFILLMYYFMYLAITVDRDDPLLPKRKYRVPWALCGIFFGIGAACKWTVLYGGAGLLVIWLGYWIHRGWKLLRAGQARRFWKQFFGNCAWCIVFFILVPGVIYYVSYYPYGAAKGMSGVGMYFQREYLDIVLDNQKFMFSYHAGVDAEHPYSSRWYQWIVDGRPILYYLQSYDDGTKGAFGCFMNPLLCWGGLLAMFSMFYLAVFRRDKKAAFISVGYLAQLVPWMFISRITFEYHYFPSTVFLVLAVCHVFDTIRSGRTNWRPYLYGATLLCLFLFVAFYPVLTGIAVPRWYTTNFLRWIPGAWPF